MPANWSDLIASIFGSFRSAPPEMTPEYPGYTSWETEEEKRRRLLEQLGVTAFESDYTVPFERPNAPQDVRAVDRGGQLLMTNLPEYGEMPDYDLEQFRSRMTQPASSYLSDQDFEIQGGMPSFDSMQLQALGSMDPRTQGADLSRLLTQQNQAQSLNDYRYGNLGVRQQNADTAAAVAPSRVDANTATAESARALAAKRLVETSFQREELQRLVSGAATPGEIAKLASVIQRIEATGLGGEFGDKLKELYAHYTSQQAVGQTPSTPPIAGAPNGGMVPGTSVYEGAQARGQREMRPSVSVNVGGRTYMGFFYPQKVELGEPGKWVRTPSGYVFVPQSEMSGAI